MFMKEDKNIYQEVDINGKKENIIIKINDGSIEDNNDFNFLDDTMEIEIIEDSHE